MFSQPHKQCSHRRMVKITPRKFLGKHMIVSLIIRQSGIGSLQKITNPPYCKPPHDYPVRAQRYAYFSKKCLHTGGKGNIFIRDEQSCFPFYTKSLFDNNFSSHTCHVTAVAYYISTLLQTFRINSKLTFTHFPGIHRTSC